MNPLINVDLDFNRLFPAIPKPDPLGDEVDAARTHRRSLRRRPRLTRSPRPR